MNHDYINAIWRAHRAGAITDQEMVDLQTQTMPTCLRHGQHTPGVLIDGVPYCPLCAAEDEGRAPRTDAELRQPFGRMR